MRHWDPIANELEESLPKLLLGRRLTAIRYYEFDHESEGFWGHEDVADTLDLAVDLIWDDGSAVCVSTKSWWDNNESGLNVQSGSYEAQCRLSNSCKTWDVSNEGRWAAFRGFRITDAKLFWLWDEDAQKFREPGDLVLGFENSRSLVLAAGSFDGKQFLVGPGYNITVVFDTETAHRFRVGPYAPTNFKRILG